MSVLNAVSRLLKKGEDRLNRELSRITAAIAVFGKTYVNGVSVARHSAGGRAQIAAQKTRSAGTQKAQKAVAMKSTRAQSANVGKKVAASRSVRRTKVTAAKKSA